MSALPVTTKFRPKWKPYSQRFAELMINSRKIVEMNNDTAKTEESSLFHEELYSAARWNHDPYFTSFVSSILTKTTTFDLLYLNREKVFEAIETYLELTYEEARPGIKDVLKLVSLLAKELRSAFYPHFPRIFTLMVRMFDPHDPDFVDIFFNCVVFLISSLARQILNDLPNVLPLFVENLFIHDRDFTRRLGAQSLAFLLRKENFNRKKTFHALMKTCVDIAEKKKQEVIDGEGTDEEKTKAMLDIDSRIVDSLGYLLFYTSHNLGTVYSFAEQELVDWCYGSDLPLCDLINDSFLKANRKLAKSVNIGAHETIVLMLSIKLPEIDHSLALDTLSIWATEKEGKFIGDTTFAVNLLGKCIDAKHESIIRYISSLQNIELPAEEHQTLSNAVIELIKAGDDITELEQCGQIAYIIRRDVLEFMGGHAKFIPSLKSVIEWLRPPPADVPENLYKILKDNIKSKREFIIPVLEFINNKELYEALLALPNKNNDEMSILYEVMQHYEPDRLSSEAPKLFDELKGNIMQEGAIEIFGKLIQVSKNKGAEWLNQEDPIFKKIINAIDYNIESHDVQKAASTILVNFVGNEKPLEDLTEIELIIRCADLVFNSTHDLKAYREGEAAINRLSEDLMKCTQSMDFLINNAFGFARQPYVHFTSHAAQLISAIIRYNKEKYGPVVSKEITKQFGVCDNVFFVPTLITATCEADYVDDNMVNLLYSYTKQSYDLGSTEENEEEEQNEEEKKAQKRANIAAKIVAQLITSVAAVRSGDSFAEKVDEATMMLLRSTKLEVRKAAFQVQFKYHVERNRNVNEQLRNAVQSQLEAYVDPSSKTDVVMRLETFLQTFDNQPLQEFCIKVAVSLAIGCFFEFLTEKVRQKHQYQHLAATLLQGLSFLAPHYVEPLIVATFPKDSEQATLRKAPAFLAPVLARLANQIYPFSAKIAEILTNSMKVCTNASTRIIKQCVKAITLFIDTEIKRSPFFKDEEELNSASEMLETSKKAFVQQILEYFEIASKYNFDPLVRALVSAKDRYPQLFADRTELVHKIAENLPRPELQFNSDLAMILADVLEFTPSLHKYIIEQCEKAIQESKLLKRPTFILGMLNLLSALRDFDNSEEFHLMIIHFVTQTQEPQAIQIMSGITWSPEHFKELSRLIGRYLEPDFRQEFVPLICESLGEFADTFKTLNTDDVANKSIVYRDLDSVGEFSFVFSMQAFADMQVNNFSLQNASAGFITRVISTNPELIEEFILPSIEFHLRKRQSKIPASEIILMLESITQKLPELRPTMTRICAMESFRLLSTADEDVLAESLLKFGEEIEALEDADTDELSTYVLPLLCKFSGTSNLAEALAPVCRRSNPEAIDKLLHKLVSSIDHNASVLLLVDLCKAKAFTPEQVTDTLMRVIESKKTSNRSQLLLISALLEINISDKVLRRVMNLVVNKALNKKQEIRDIGQEAITSVTLKLPKEKYYDFFQTMRAELREGYGIPLLYCSLCNFISNAPEIGGFDPFIKLVVECLLDDVFGRPAQLRVQMKDSLPEAKKCYTFTSFEKLAGKIVFGDAIKQVNDVLKEKFDTIRFREQARGAKKIIESFTIGLLENETITADGLISVAKELLVVSKEDKIIKHRKFRGGHKEEKEIKYGRMCEDDYILEKPQRSAEENGLDIQVRIGKNFLISLYAMKMLVVFFDKDMIIPEANTEEEEQDESYKAQIAALDDLFNDVWRFTKSTVDRETLIVSLTILEHYANHPEFQSFNNSIDDICKFITVEIGKMSNVTDLFGKRIFSFLKTLLENRLDLQITSEFANALITFCNDKLDIHESSEDVFGVLILLIKRVIKDKEEKKSPDQQLQIPAIISTADQCYELIIRAQSETVRRLSANLCALVLTTFFKKKISVVKDKIKFVLTNLQTNKTTARKSLILFLNDFLDLANEKQLEETHDLTFAFLGATIANETDTATFSSLKDLITKLLLSNNQLKITTDFQLMTKWASSPGKVTRTGLLLLSVAAPLSPEAAIPELEKLVDERVLCEDQKVVQAAIQLHKAIVSSFPENESIKLFNAEQLLSLLENKETCRVGCEIIQWYLSDYSEKFEPNEEETMKLAEKLLYITFQWSGVIAESGISLSIIMAQMGDEQLVSFIPKLEEYTEKDDNSETAILLFMRSIVATINQKEGADDEENEEEEEKKEKTLSTPPLFLRFVLKFIDKQMNSKVKALKKAGTTAMSVLKREIEATAFATEWAAIVEEKDRIKKEKMEQTAADKLLDPETLRAKRKEQKELKKIEKRKKRYLEDDAFNGTLHAFGPDGKRVESVELPFQFLK